MEPLWISTSDFSKNPEDLVLQIRWLLNEMAAAATEIELGNLYEAKKILTLEVEKKFFMTITKK